MCLGNTALHLYIMRVIRLCTSFIRKTNLSYFGITAKTAVFCFLCFQFGAVEMQAVDCNVWRNVPMRFRKKLAALLILFQNCVDYNKKRQAARQKYH